MLDRFTDPQNYVRDSAKRPILHDIAYVCEQSRDGTLMQPNGQLRPCLLSSTGTTHRSETSTEQHGRPIVRTRVNMFQRICGEHTLSLPTVVAVNLRVSLTVGWRMSCDARAAIARAIYEQ